MEKKFVIIMVTIIFLLAATIGVLLVLNFGANSNISPNGTSNLNVGSNEPMEFDTIEFGGITWRILDERDGQKLLLSEYVLEERAFHGRFVSITWADSNLRRWLNDEFYNKFAEDERARIAETHVLNNDNQWFGTPGGQDTTDKIFLLSLEEVVRYFGDSGQLTTSRDHPYLGMWWGFEDEFSDLRIAHRLNGEHSTWWLLRSPGITSDYVAHICISGLVGMDGFMANEAAGVRPAMWIYL